MDYELLQPCSATEVAEALHIASLMGPNTQLVKVIRRLAFERDGLRRIEAIEPEFIKIQEQRADLLSALRECVAWFEDNCVDCYALDEAREALKKAKGK